MKPLRLLAVSLVLACTPALAQDRPNPSLDQFMSSRTNVTGLENGGAFYVSAPTPSAGDDLSYVDATPRAGIALTPEGDSVAIRGRYNRRLGRVEVEYERNLVWLEGKYFPVVCIGGETYHFVTYPEGREMTSSYAALRAGGARERFTAYFTYVILAPNTASVDRGIVPAPANVKPRLDSTAYLAGLRDYLVPLPRRRRQLVGDLGPCELAVLEAMHDKYAPTERSYLVALVDALNAACPTN